MMNRATNTWRSFAEHCRTEFIPFHPVFCFLLVMCGTPHSIAQVAEQEQEQVDQKTSLRILVQDPDGQPIEGAIVSGSGLRSRIASYGWFGEAAKVATDKEGIAIYPSPKEMIEAVEAESIFWSVEHPDYLTVIDHRRVEDDPAKFVLQRGFRIAITAVDGRTQQPVKDHLYAIVSSEEKKETWELASNGTLISSVLANSPTIVRVMQVIEGEPVLFSDRIEVDPEGRSRVMLSDIELKPGVRVEGKLDDSIPRPIKNGQVASAISASLGRDANGRLSNWVWRQVTDVNEDGTFVFESLPAGETLQLIPLCEGYVPATPTADDIRPFFPEELRKANVGRFCFPQFVRLEAELNKTVLKMEAGVSCRVTVVGLDGKPLENAVVTAGPNQYWLEIETSG